MTFYSVLMAAMCQGKHQVGRHYSRKLSAFIAVTAPVSRMRSSRERPIGFCGSNGSGDKSEDPLLGYLQNAMMALRTPTPHKVRDYLTHRASPPYAGGNEAYTPLSGAILLTIELSGGGCIPSALRICYNFGGLMDSRS